MVGNDVFIGINIHPFIVVVLFYAVLAFGAWYIEIGTWKNK